MSTPPDFPDPTDSKYYHYSGNHYGTFAPQHYMDDVETWFTENIKENPTHCSDCGIKLEPARVSPGLPGSGRVVFGGWYTTRESSDPLCLACVRHAVKEKET